MPAPNPFAVCGLALVVVFLLLAFLAAVMRLITQIFPDRGSRLDPVLVAAVSATVAALHPGARVTKIEEEL